MYVVSAFRRTVGPASSTLVMKHLSREYLSPESPDSGTRLRHPTPAPDSGTYSGTDSSTDSGTGGVGRVQKWEMPIAVLACQCKSFAVIMLEAS